jgi:hypothetical protein
LKRPQSVEAVQGGDDNDSLTFSSHRIASESLSNPSLTNVRVSIDACLQKASLDETDTDYSRYEESKLLAIRNDDRLRITLYGLVLYVHEYLNANKEEVHKCEEEIYINPVNLGDSLREIEVEPNDTSVQDDATGNDFLKDAGFIFDRVLINKIDIDE